jgi:predicted Rdx family selenoprotein
VAAELKRATGLDTKLLIGGSGEFTVWLDEQLVAEKKMGVFPSADAVVAAVRAAITPTPDTGEKSL